MTKEWNIASADVWTYQHISNLSQVVVISTQVFAPINPDESKRELWPLVV